MLHRKFLAVLALLSVANCSSSTPLKDMVGYVPPTSLPAQSKRTLVADRQEQVWAQLVEFLRSSAFEIDQYNEAENLLVARYSGNPEPYIDCGSIVTHQNGSLGQIAGSAATIALNYEVEQDPLVLNRTLNLDSQIIIKLADQPQGTVVRTDTTYVVTKTIDIADPSGAIREASRETVSFEAGSRAEFSKGTACQPNGSLDLAVIRSLPNIVASDEIDHAELEDSGIRASEQALGNDDLIAELPQSSRTQVIPITPDTADDHAKSVAIDVEGLDAATTPSPVPEGIGHDWVLPEQGLPTAALPAPESVPPEHEPPIAKTDTTALSAPTPNDVDDLATSSLREEQNQHGSLALTAEKLPSDAAAAKLPSIIVDETTKKLLDSLNCNGEEWHFCDLVELTTPYRKRNIDEFFGLTINISGSFTSQVVGHDLKLDILFPSFSSHLHIAYARRDGTIEHVMSSTEAWPADLAHQIAQAEKAIPGPAGLAMIIAIASEKPLFSSPPDGVEDATAYLDRLKQRLTEFENSNPGGPIAASQLLIYVENAKT